MKTTNHMITGLFAITSLVFAATVCAEDKEVGVKTEPKRLQANIPAEVIKRARPHVRRPTGGMLAKKVTGKVIAVRNAQKTIPADALAAAAEYARQHTYLPVFIVGADEKRDDIAAEIVLVDAPARAGQTVILAPEQHFAELATGWLVADSPTAEKRAIRINAELTRVVLMTLGCGISPFQPDLMCYVSDTKMLDRLGKATVGPAVRSVYEETRQRIGIEKFVYSSYRKACQEGWAPAPTNDVQRAIWDEVHEIPSEPIKIEKK